MEVEQPLETSAFSSTVDKERRKERRLRILQLAQPKISKAVWATSEPRIIWGNQDPMRPVSGAALKTQVSQRVSELATPKKNFQLDNPQKCCRDNFMYSCGRSSVICEVSPFAMKTNSSERIESLAKPKLIPNGYQEDRKGYTLGCGRSSPIWEVTSAAKMKGDISERLSVLSEPKKTHQEYFPARDVHWPVNIDIRSSASSRVEMLARPKERSEGPFRFPQWVVSKSARNANATNRVLELSQPKKLTDSYRPNRDVEWRVTRSALKANPTERIQTLATPIVRDTMDHVQFDPLAFQVKKSALKGRVPDRIHDLSQPIIRGPNIQKR